MADRSPGDRGTGHEMAVDATTGLPAPDDAATVRGSRSRLRIGLRVRMLGFAAALLAGAALGGLAVQRTVLLQRHDDEVDQMLEQERQELQRLAAGRDPATGDPFAGDVAAIFDTFIARNVPAPGETFVTFVDGAPHRSTPAPISLDQVPELRERWADLQDGERGQIETEEGPVKFLAVPLASGGETRGVFVAANFLQAERRSIDDDLRVQATVVAVVVILATAIAWLTAGRLLRPLRTVTDTARTITDKGLSQRIPVETDDEVGELARTFNQMLDRLEESFAGQRAFIDDAGHELRTPITVIMGQLEVMGDDPDDRRRTLGVVNDELQRMARIVEDLLVLAKAEQPDFVRLEPVELNDFTTEILVKARLLGDREWRFDGSATGVVDADRQRLTQALLNLVRNAVENTPEGTVIGVGNARVHDRVRIWVRDEGPGIAPAEQARIFDRFARGPGARRRSDGAGLGLAIVRAVAVAHGGTVHLDSETGRGARFTIELPAPTTAVPDGAPDEGAAQVAVPTVPLGAVDPDDPTAVMDLDRVVPGSDDPTAVMDLDRGVPGSDDPTVEVRPETDPDRSS